MRLRSKTPEPVAIARKYVESFKVPSAELNLPAFLAAILVLAAGFVVNRYVVGQWDEIHPAVAGVAIFLAVYILFALKVANQWDRAVILRLGRFHRLKGPGAFFIVPIIESIVQTVDMRIRATDFSSESTLTKDTVPVNVDAICFWMVWDAKKAILEVENYYLAIVLSAQTALRDIIGTHELADMLTHRGELGSRLREILDEKTNPWGITVQSVEIRDIIIPKDLEDAMSKQAQAERERQARIILGTAETEIAQKFAQAAKQYEANPMAMHLRGMNMLFEGLKEKGSMIIVPSSALETMNLGAMGGLAALSQTHTDGPAHDASSSGRANRGSTD
ncbi:MAG: SPFH domain-containing protein [Sedimentisphaerales bacterium]|nr:SPFH domain-containing protein [Sedimentisphaerales bacterium]NLZ04224.1 slipin family protein [Phycisphaerae bacterium]HNY79841.1 SPFH domain-containing protein [Sedimentisphaerales bacterium]HOC64843.1 SPFH domain-containing protein [Sedimentisphaerales bacterium]HOH65773.1 SPFH domain-containing protein [Sedimentisphaerales bacterium]